MSDYYVLDGHEPVTIADLHAWGAFHRDIEKRRVAVTELADNVSVSTVFLGLDHGYGPGGPVLFESMVFGGEHDSSCWRYRAWDAAEAGHERIVAALRDAAPLDFDLPMGGAS